MALHCFSSVCPLCRVPTGPGTWKTWKFEQTFSSQEKVRKMSFLAKFWKSHGKGKNYLDKSGKIGLFVKKSQRK